MSLSGITTCTFHFVEVFTELFTSGVDNLEHCGNKDKEKHFTWWRFSKGL